MLQAAKVKHQRQLHERAAEVAELQQRTSTLTKDATRLSKQLAAAQREAAVLKQAAADAHARARDCAKEVVGALVFCFSYHARNTGKHPDAGAAAAPARAAASTTAAAAAAEPSNTQARFG